MLQQSRNSKKTKKALPAFLMLLTNIREQLNPKRVQLFMMMVIPLESMSMK